MNNRGTISTARIAEKLKKVENDLGITAPEQKQKPFYTSPLLFVNGRLDRKNHLYIAKNFSLLSPLNDEIKKYCKGIDLTILNYLIFLGLKSLKKENEFKSIEYSEFETNL